MDKLKNAFSLDERSLAAFRMALGLIVLYDWCYRISDFTMFYTDAGTFMRQHVIDMSHNYRLSIHFMNGHIWFNLLIFFAYLFSILCFIFGRHTWIATIATYIFNISLQNRNYMILNTGDTLIRVMLFWSIFVPLGRVWSIDNIKTKMKPKMHFSIGGIGLMLQLCYMYWFTAWLKDGAEWTQTYTAGYFALQIDQFLTYFGKWLAQFYGFLKVATFATIWWEWIGPVLVFIPFCNQLFRGIAVLGMFALHGSFLAMLNIGIFSAISGTGWIMFIPSKFWNYIETKEWFQKVQMKLYSVGQKFHVQVNILPPFKKKRFQIIPLFFLIFITYWNFATVKKLNMNIPRGLSNFSQILRIDQQWSMFSPFPLKDDGWFVWPGELDDGTKVDAYNRTVGEPSFKKPNYIYYPNQRWRKYIMNLRQNENETHRLNFGRWLCRTWNKDVPGHKRLKSFKFYYMREFTLDNYKTEPVTKNMLWSHQCY